MSHYDRKKIYLQVSYGTNNIFILFLIYLKLTTQATQAVHINKITIPLKIVSMLINVNWKILKTIKLKSPIA